MRNKNQDDTNFKGGNQVVYRWHDCLHGGKKKNSAKKILQITSEFDKVAECKMEKCTILYKKNLQWQRKNC